MKRHFMALAAAACLMLSGCSSGVSQEEYDSLASKNSELQEKINSVNLINSDLSSDNSALEEENKKLKEEKEELTIKVEELSEELTTYKSTNTGTEDNGEWEVVKTPGTDTPWIFSEDKTILATDIGTIIDQFSEKDEALIGFCYLDLLSYACSDEYKDYWFFYLFWYNNGELIGSSIVAHFGDELVSSKGIQWQNGYERLNDNEENTKYLQIISGLNQNKDTVKSPFECDGYQYAFSGEYDFVTVDNQFSEHNGQTAISLEVEIENLSSPYNYAFGCYKIISPNGNQVDQVSALFSDGYIRELPTGSKQTGSICFMYDGDGEYQLYFFEGLGNKIYKVNISS